MSTTIVQFEPFSACLRPLSLNTFFKMDLLCSTIAVDQAAADRTITSCMFFALFVVVALSGLHCYLASTNQTTHEMIKPQVADKWREEELARRHQYLKRHRDQGDAQHLDEQELEDRDNRKPGTPGPRGRRRKKWKQSGTFDIGFVSKW